MNQNTLWNNCLAVGTQFELLFEDVVSSLPGTSVVYKADHKEASYDYLVVVDGVELRCELKSIAGISKGVVYSTFCIETVANDGRGKTNGTRPGWWIATETNQLDLVVVLNRHEKKMYNYDAKTLLAFVKAKEARSGVGSRASNGGTGFVQMVPWSSREAGLLSVRDVSSLCVG